MASFTIKVASQFFLQWPLVLSKQACKESNLCPAITGQDDFDFFDDGRVGCEEPHITRD